MRNVRCTPVGIGQKLYSLVSRKSPQIGERCASLGNAILMMPERGFVRRLIGLRGYLPSGFDLTLRLQPVIEFLPRGAAACLVNFGGAPADTVFSDGRTLRSESLHFEVTASVADAFPY